MMSQESPAISPPEIIRKKRDGLELTEGEIKGFITGLSTGVVADYQMSALLMAIFKSGMSDAETAHLTDAMLYSGSVLEFSTPHVVDKHSTGGVGDKSSFILGPLAAACGVKVPMMAGRGLGHTGGTVDKIEAVKGYQTELSLTQFKAMVEQHGLSLIGQTQEIAPADKKIYALRDVTATVESIPLITASIMSKKLAEGAQGIVMDVKTGSGAFMRKKSDARALGKSLLKTAKRFDRSMMVFLTDMSQPTGEMIGHSHELIECFEVLKGRGPKDITELSIELAAGMVLLAGLAPSLTQARKKVREAWREGRGLEELKKLIERHGGDQRVVDDYSLLPQASVATSFCASKAGYLKEIHTKELGLFLLSLGGGRLKASDRIDHAVGLRLRAKLGSKLKAGQEILTVYHHAHQQDLVNEALSTTLPQIFRLSSARPQVPPLIHDSILHLAHP